MGGHGIFGVEFFVSGDQAIFSELSPRPHDTGMVTLISQFPNEFELHLRAILGFPIPSIELVGPSASAVILGDRESDNFHYDGVAEALALGSPGNPVDLRIFAKPKTLKNRRMGVALARGATRPRTRSSAPSVQPLASRYVMSREGGAMHPKLSTALLIAAALAGCNQPSNRKATSRRSR